jgi:hypothetical protein
LTGAPSDKVTWKGGPPKPGPGPGLSGAVLEIRLSLPSSLEQATQHMPLGLALVSVRSRGQEPQ